MSSGVSRLTLSKTRLSPSLRGDVIGKVPPVRDTRALFFRSLHDKCGAKKEPSPPGLFMFKPHRFGAKKISVLIFKPWLGRMIVVPKKLDLIKSMPSEHLCCFERIMELCENVIGTCFARNAAALRRGRHIHSQSFIQLIRNNPFHLFINTREQVVDYEVVCVAIEREQ